jgi:hypothetical protein
MPDSVRQPDITHRRLPERTAGPISLRSTTSVRLGERRDLASREALVRRVSVEFHDMPGLSLTLAQAQRLFGLREDICLRVLDTLVTQEILRVDAKGAFVRNGGRP